MKNLSDTRGRHGGILFFRIFIRIFGVRHACRFVTFVTFFYALFDVRAKQAIKPYLKARFPEERMFLHRWRLFTHQGRALILAGYPEALVPVSAVWHEVLEYLGRNPGKGLIVLCSHFGAWQIAMRQLPRLGRKVWILERADLNRQADKKMSVEEDAEPGFIPVDGFMGGLLDCLAALERGEVVCVMGDRSGSGRMVGGELFGEKFAFPAAPFHLAARSECPLFPLFCVLDVERLELKYRFFAPIFIGNGDLAGGVREYAAALEKMAGEYPYDFFCFNGK